MAILNFKITPFCVTQRFFFLMSHHIYRTGTYISNFNLILNFLFSARGCQCRHAGRPRSSSRRRRPAACSPAHPPPASQPLRRPPRTAAAAAVAALHYFVGCGIASAQECYDIVFLVTIQKAVKVVILVIFLNLYFCSISGILLT
jgi:hypothetical protein